MIAALLTSFFFALSAIFGRRSAVYLGSQRANLARQVLALTMLGCWAHVFGQGLGGGVVFWILFWSGVIGFGIGDWGLFEAYPRIGAALTILVTQCLAAPVAAVTEWLWLGTGMTALQIASSAVILVGVALAMASEKDSDIPHDHRLAGTLFGVMAAGGQAWGAVISRYAFQRAELTGFHLDGITAAYQRLWGGVVSLAVLLVVRRTIFNAAVECQLIIVGEAQPSVGFIGISSQLLAGNWTPDGAVGLVGVIGAKAIWQIA